MVPLIKMNDINIQITNSIQPVEMVKLQYRIMGRRIVECRSKDNGFLVMEQAKDLIIVSTNRGGFLSQETPTLDRLARLALDDRLDDVGKKQLHDETLALTPLNKNGITALKTRYP